MQSFKTLQETSWAIQNIGAQLNYKKTDSSIFTEAGRGMKEFAYSYVPGTKRVGPSTNQLMTQWDTLKTKKYDPLSEKPQQTAPVNKA
jgi:hypothetical protein